jgi:hypothetical protein
MADEFSQSDIQQFCIEIDGAIGEVSGNIRSIQSEFSSQVFQPIRNAESTNGECCDSISNAITLGVSRIVETLQMQYSPLSLQLASQTDAVLEQAAITLSPFSQTSVDVSIDYPPGYEDKKQYSDSQSDPWNSELFVIKWREIIEKKISEEPIWWLEIPVPEVPDGWERFVFCDTITGETIVTKDAAAFLASPRFTFFGQVNNPANLTNAIENAADNCKPKDEDEIPPEPPQWRSKPCNLNLYDDEETLKKIVSPLEAIWETTSEVARIESENFAKQKLGSAIPFLVYVVKALIAIPYAFVWGAGKVAEGIMSTFGCSVTGRGMLWSTHGLTSFLSYIAPGAFQQLNTYLGQAQNRLCPVKIPDPESVIAAYLGNDITLITAKGLIEANGFCWEYYEKIIEARRAKLVPGEILQLLNRGVIDEPTARYSLRELGYTRESELLNLMELRHILPNQSDLIRMMVRDADDENIVNTFKLDTEFIDKVPEKGKIREWAKALGLPLEVLQYVWRSHWIIPSPGQLFTMLQRLEWRPTNPTGDVSKPDIITALKQQDILPFWIDKFERIAYNPLTRIDTRRAYEIGELSEDDVYESYRQQGYNDDNAKILVKFSIRLKQMRVYNERAIRWWVNGDITKEQAEQRLRKLGYTDEFINDAFETSFSKFRSSKLVSLVKLNKIKPKTLHQSLIDNGVSEKWARKITQEASIGRRRNRTVSQYRLSLISKDIAMQRLIDEFIPEQDAIELLNDIDDEIKAKVNSICAESIVEQFMNGTLNEAQTRAELAGRLNEIGKANAAIEAAKCKLAARDKSPAIAQLCKWFSEGVFNAVELNKRIQNLGYSQKNSQQIANDCIAKLNAEMAAKQKKEFDKAIKEQEAERKKALANADKAKAAAERARKASEASDKARLARNNRLLNAVEKAMKTSGKTLDELLLIANELRRAVQQEYGLPIGPAYDSVVQGIDAAIIAESEDYQTFIRKIAKQFSNENQKGTSE